MNIFVLRLTMSLRLPMLDLAPSQHIYDSNQRSRVDHAKIEWNCEYFLASKAGSIEEPAEQSKTVKRNLADGRDLIYEACLPQKRAYQKKYQ